MTINPTGPSTPVPIGGASNPFGPLTSPLTFNDAVFASQAKAVIIPVDAQIPLLKYVSAISAAQLQQALQELLTNLENATALNGMWRDAQDQAAALRDFITKIYGYLFTQNEVINDDNITGQENIINQEITTYNNAVNQPGGDKDQVQQMNDAIAAFNAAQGAYNQALQTHGGAVIAQQAALNAYNAALQDWNNALAAYNASGGTTDLSAAQAAFSAAQSTFDSAQASFNSEEASYATALSDYQGASDTFHAAQTNYNAYATARNADIAQTNQAIDNWNAFATLENVKIAKLNAVRATLTPPLPPLPQLPTVPHVQPLGLVSDPGISPLQNQIEQNIQNYNTQATSINNSITGTVNPLIDLINGTYGTSLTDVPGVAGMPDIPLLPLGSVPTLPTPTTLNPIIYTPPSFIDVITIYLQPRLALISKLAQANASANLFSQYLENVTSNLKNIRDFAGRENFISNTGASVNMTTLGRQATASSPYLEQILSKQVNDAITNQYGARVASPIVDWAGSLSVRLLAHSGLTAAGPGNKILDKTVYDNIKGHSAFNVAISLGFLKQISNVTSSEFLPQSVLGYINGDPTLSNLSQTQKDDLVALISGDVSKNLLLIGLSDVARNLQMPGLTPQLLAILAGIQDTNALSSLNNQLLESTLSEEIGKLFELSNQATDAISQAALQQSQREDAELEKSTLVSSLQNSFSQAGVPVEPNDPRINEIADAVILQILANKQKQEELKVDAFRREIAFGIQQSRNVDESEAFKTANRIATPSNLANLSHQALQLLPRQGLTDAEIEVVLGKARAAYLAKEPSANPLSSYSLERVGTTQELGSLFKTNLQDALTDAIGTQKAKDVASSYAGLIFSSPNSVLDTLQDIQRRDRETRDVKISDRKKDALNESFATADKLYLHPGAYLEKLVSPAKLLLALGASGGPSMQGATFMDNNLGRTGHYKTPTSIQAA